MNATTLQRYETDGDIYRTLVDRYGMTNAERVRDAAGREFRGEEGAVSSTLAEIRNGSPLSESTGGIFLDQLATDPLGAPLDAANAGLGNVVGNTIAGIFRNPWVLLALVAFVLIQFPKVRQLVFK